MAPAALDVIIPVMGVDMSVVANGAVPGIDALLCRVAELRQWRCRNLSAPFWRCYVVLRGAAVLGEAAGPRHELRPGRIWLIPPDTEVDTELLSPTRKAYLHFTLTTWRQGTSPGCHHDDGPPGMTRALVRAADDPPVLGTTMLALATRALAALPWRAPPAEEDRRIERAIALMQRHCAEPWDNARLAAAVHLSCPRFAHLFTAVTGCPPQSYYRELRLRRAAVLLIQSDASIEAIAERTGFADRHHLTRAFTCRYHHPPARYRRLHVASM